MPKNRLEDILDVSVKDIERRVRANGFKDIESFLEYYGLTVYDLEKFLDITR